MVDKKIRIGNSSGYWGDDPDAMLRQLKHHSLDYLTADYLAEVSMSILSKQQKKHPEMGYVYDFIEHVENSLEQLKQQPVRIITNAGGNNPIGCATRLAKILEKHKIHKKIIAVTGDNIIEQVTRFQQQGETFQHMEDHRSFSEVASRLTSANVYIGSQSIVKALKAGADIIITGRAADSALVIGPLQYEFKWKADDWDRLAGGMIAGHVIECGAQATGGNFTDWQSVNSWTEMAYPVIEVAPDGSFTLSLPENQGGLVSQFTVKEQLVYEIADPGKYTGPDVVADIRTIKLEEVSLGKVRVSGAQGKPAPNTWKVSMAYQDGFKASGAIILSAPHALAKARTFKKIFWQRIGLELEKTNTSMIGYDATQPYNMETEEPPEILLQFTAFDHDRSKLERFARHLSGLILSGPPGVAVTGGRPRIQEVVRYWPALIDKTKLTLTLYEVLADQASPIETIKPVEDTETAWSAETEPINHNGQGETDLNQETMSKKMYELCLARSGDKGDTVNIGVVARTEKIYDYLKMFLTDRIIKVWFADYCKGSVIRYELDNLNALNFVLNQALDGGGTYSGRIDPQGKTFASFLLNQTIEVPISVF
ncbi:MAG: acyclic terpene utilization AtuA family protein [Candidatus Cyclobacteriaceae bacterium M3_2C_046]